MDTPRKILNTIMGNYNEKIMSMSIYVNHSYDKNELDEKIERLNKEIIKEFGMA